MYTIDQLLEESRHGRLICFRNGKYYWISKDKLSAEEREKCLAQLRNDPNLYTGIEVFNLQLQSAVPVQQHGGGLQLPSAVQTAIIDAVKVGASAGADIVTGGMGGDVVVSIFSAIVESGQFLETLNKLVLATPELQHLTRDLTFEHGPTGVKDQIDAMNDIDFVSICPIITQLLDKVSVVAGDWIGATMPDTAGVGGITVQQIIRHGNYNKLKMVYDHLPEAGRNILEDPNGLRNMFKM